MSNFNESIILFGGSSEERRVSVATAQNIARNIPEARLWFWSLDDHIYVVTAEELAAHQDAFIKEFTVGRAPAYDSLKSSLNDLTGKTVIMGIHGTEGEDGKLQALLESKHIKFTGSNSKASNLAFDKRATKELARKVGIRNHSPSVLRSAGDPGWAV